MSSSLVNFHIILALEVYSSVISFVLCDKWLPQQIPWSFRNGELFKRSIGLVTLWLGSHTSNTGLAELLYIGMEAGPRVSMVD